MRKVASFCMEQRKYPRYNVISQQQVLHLSGKEISKSRVLSKNISASGFCFRSARPYELEKIVFVHLQAQEVSDLEINRAGILKSGNYFLARVIWSRPASQNDDPFFEIGCSFISREEGNPLTLDLFTRCLNQYSADFHFQNH